MLYDTLIFLPFFACVFWLLFTCLTAARTSTYVPMVLTLIVMLLYIFTDSCYASPNMPPRMLVYTSVLAEFTAPTLIPLVWMYQMRLRGQGRFHASQMYWLFIPGMLGSITLLLTMMAGVERIQAYQELVFASGFQLDAGTTDPILRAYFYTTTLFFRSVLVLETLVYVAKAIHLMHKDNLRLRHLRKLYAGERIRVLELQVFIVIGVTIPFLPKMVLSHASLMAMPLLSALLGILITIGVSKFCFMSLFGAKRFITKDEMRSVMRYNYRVSNKQHIIEEMLGELVGEADDEVLYRLRQRIGLGSGASREHAVELPKSLTSSLFSTVAKSWDDDSLLSRFEQLMLRGQAFLEPGITLSDVAERLHSNKTYVSRLVNNTYNLAVPDLINTLRVEFAEQYIVLHRDARQNEVATASGFASASSFNNVFKKVTGMTPKIWLATYDRDHHVSQLPHFGESAADHPAVHAPDRPASEPDLPHIE